MVSISVLCVQLTIMVISLIFNGFGFYTFQKRLQGNKNQHMLLQNLAAVEIVKTLYDFIPLLLYYFYVICGIDWYKSAIHYLVVMEVNVMTTIYMSFVAVSLDRLLCVVLEMKYAYLVTERCVKVGIVCTWVCTTFPGFLVWMFFPHPEEAKRYYYLGWDVLVLLLIIPTYALVFKILRSNRRRLQFFTTKSKSKMQYQSLVVGVLLTLSFLAFNLVPDVVILLFSSNHTAFSVVSLLWSVGYLVDPFVYIFASKQSRNANQTSFSKIITRIEEGFSVAWIGGNLKNDGRGLVAESEHDLDDSWRVSCDVESESLPNQIVVLVHDQTEE